MSSKAAVSVALVASTLLTLGLAGCSYALLPVTPPSQERVRIVAKSPALYSVRVDVGHVADYRVPDDGRISLGLPAYRHGCSVLLFNLIKVSNGSDPVSEWTVTVSSRGKSVRQLTFRDLGPLSTDPEGYRLLKVGDSAR